MGISQIINMSQRFPPATPSSLHTTLDAEVKKHHGENPSFTYKDADGAPIGPFAVLACVLQKPTNI